MTGRGIACPISVGHHHSREGVSAGRCGSGWRANHTVSGMVPRAVLQARWAGARLASSLRPPAARGSRWSAVSAPAVPHRWQTVPLTARVCAISRERSRLLVSQDQPAVARSRAARTARVAAESG
jgi:hypothetical protein